MAKKKKKMVRKKTARSSGAASSAGSTGKTDRPAADPEMASDETELGLGSPPGKPSTFLSGGPPQTALGPQAAASADDTAAPLDIAAEPASAGPDWQDILATIIRPVLDFAGGRWPAWETSETEIKMLADGWAPLAARYLAGLDGPWTSALAVTAIWATPRLSGSRHQLQEAQPDPMTVDP